MVTGHDSQDIYIFRQTLPRLNLQNLYGMGLYLIMHTCVGFFGVFFMFYQHTISYGVLLGYILMQSVQIIFDEA